MSLPRGRGPEWAKVMIVGEAWGADEEREKQPFVGKAGQLLRKALMSAGVDPDEIYYTNIVNQRPPANKLIHWFDKAGMPNELVMKGLQQLRDEIEIVNPNLIVGVGSFPLWALTGRAKWNKKKRPDSDEPYGYTGIGNYRGSILQGNALTGGRKVLCTYHPAYILREGAADSGLFDSDLRKIAGESQYPEIRRPDYTKYIDPRGGERAEVEARIMDSPDLIIDADIEYLGRKLICVGFSNSRDWAASVAIKNQDDLMFVDKILMQGGSGLCWQNAMFDVSILEWWYNIPAMSRTVFDTMLCAHAANIELPKSLDVLASIYTEPNQPFWDINWTDVKNGRVSLEDILVYNATDVWVTTVVREEQTKWELSDPKTKRVFDFEMLLLEPLWQMSKRGVRMDTAALKELSHTLRREIAERAVMLDRIAGREINVKSTKDVATLLYDQYGLPKIKVNKTGPATDDKTLAELIIKATNDTQKGLVNLIRDIRSRVDLASKFTDVEFDEDDRMRGMYNPAGTTTGRLSSKKFYPTGRGVQQQNAPRDKRVRSVAIADDGMEICNADLERAESLVVAHLTNDPLMLQHHAPGQDAHKLLAAILFDKPVEEIGKDSDERYLGKQTRHAGNYMEGPITFMKNVNKYATKTGVSLTMQEAKKLIFRYRDIHPGLQRWWDATEAELWRSRTLENLLGRRRTFYGHVGSLIPTAVAYVPQSTVGDTLNVGFLNMHGRICEYVQEWGLADHYLELYEQLRQLGGVQCLLQVHDSVVFQYEKEKRNDVLPLVRKLLSVPLRSPKTYEEFTIAVEMAVGPSWGEVEKWVEDQRAGA